jgi:hypothetical protein|tara:strand:- start:1985 stop:2680 length:696 start_codon:yes stop_codon:yes gene_type:complete
MEKQKLDGFINRYNLGGEVESVMVKSDGANLSVKMISDDKTLLGDVSVSGAEFPEGEFGIYTTSQLRGLLSVLDNSITIEEVTGALKFSDKGTKMQYMLAAPSVIPAVPDLKALPPFNVTVKLDDEFVNKFIKSKGALADADTFTFTSKAGVSEIILGYSSINSNRISITVDAQVEGDVDPIQFSAKYLKAILMSNKNSNTSSLEISSQGLSKLVFTDGDYASNYYLVEIK